MSAKIVRRIFKNFPKISPEKLMDKSQNFKTIEYHKILVNEIMRLSSLPFPTSCPGGVGAPTLRCSIKSLFLKISQNSQENICFEASFLKETTTQVFSYEFYELFEEHLLYRTPLGNCFCQMFFQ